MSADRQTFGAWWRTAHPLQRAGWVMTLAGMLGFVLIFVTEAVPRIFAVGIQTAPVFFAVMSMAVVGPLVYWIGQRRLRRGLKACEFSRCTGCGYVLQGLSAAGTCPECGGEYTLEELREVWMQTVDARM